MQFLQISQVSFRRHVENRTEDSTLIASDQT